MSITLAELADRIGAALRGDPAKPVAGCAGLEEAGEGEVSFLANSAYLDRLATTRAAAVILSRRDAARVDHLDLLIAEDPYFAFRQAVVALHGFRRQPEPAVSKQASIHETAALGRGCSIAPFVYIDEGATIGDGCVLYPHCYIGAGVVLGRDCVLYPSVTVYDRCVLGDRVILHSGCVIGQDGFGHATHAGAHHKIPQVGNVIVEDDVEMGANCAIDRATMGATVIGKGTKFSDAVVIGHGTKVGRHNLFVAQVGIAGSVQIGDHVLIGGQSGVSGHLKIGDRAQIAAKSVAFDDVPEGTRVFGVPALEAAVARRAAVLHGRLPELARQLRDLQKRLERLEAAGKDTKQI